MRSWEPGWSSIMLQIDLHFPESFRCLSLGQSKLHNRGCPTHSRTLRKGWVVGSSTHSGDENTDWAGNPLIAKNAMSGAPSITVSALSRDTSTVRDEAVDSGDT